MVGVLALAGDGLGVGYVDLGVCSGLHVWFLTGGVLYGSLYECVTDTL